MIFKGYHAQSANQKHVNPEMKTVNKKLFNPTKLLIIFCLASLSISAQPIKRHDTLQVNQLVKKSQYFVELSQKDSAIYFAQLAYKQAKKSKFYPGMSIAQFMIGATRLSLMDQTKESSPFFHQSFIYAAKSKDSLQMAKCQNALGVVYRNQNLITKSIKCLEAADVLIKNKNDFKLKATIALNLFRSYQKNNDFVKAFYYLDKLEELASHTGDELLIARVYQEKGYIATNREFGYGSLKYFELALEILNKHGEKSLMQIADINYNIARMYVRNEDFSSGRRYAKKAENIINSISENHLHLAKVAALQVVIDLHFQETETAERRLRKGMALYENKVSIDRNNGLFLLETKARIHVAKGEFEKALAILKTLENKNSNHKARIREKIGGIYLQTHEYRHAILWLEKAIDEMDRHYKNNQREYFQVKKNMELGKASKKLADAYYLGYSQSQHLKDLQSARHHYLTSDSLLAEVRYYAMSEEARKAYNQFINKVHASLFEIHFKLFKNTNQTAHLHKAFYFLEKNRAYNLPKIQKTKSNTAWKDYRDQLHILNKQKSLWAHFSELGDSISAYEEKMNMFKTAISVEKIETEIAKNNPDLFRFTFSEKDFSIKKIQKSLKKDEAIVAYNITDSQVFATFISSESLVIQELGLVPDELIDNFTQSIVNQNFEKYCQNSHQLYLKLVAPLNLQIQKVSTLFFSCDKNLWRINFDLLIKQMPGADHQYRSLSYLLQDFNIGYLPSCSSIIRRNIKNTPIIAPRVLAFSYSDMNGLSNSPDHHIPLKVLRNEKQPIPGTSQEVKAIATHFDGSYFFGKNATEDNLKESIKKKNYQILHLAIHGQVDFENPGFSKLIFPTSIATGEDGNLYAFEVRNNNFRYEMVVLSACQSGTGRLVYGDGPLSMGHAFYKAGAESLLVSFWDLQDQTTSKLVSVFYENLAKGMTKDSALRQAKLHFLKNADNAESAPFYWGALYFIGNNTPLIKRTNIFTERWLVIGLFISIAMFICYQRSSIRNSLIN